MKIFKIKAVPVLSTMFVSVILTACSGDNRQTEFTSEEISQLAVKVKKNEVVLYGSEDCPYCRQAKSWFDEHNFTFKDCDMNKIPKCYKEYQKLEGNGIPFIVINRNGKQHIMKDGFDSNQFLTILKEK